MPIDTTDRLRLSVCGETWSCSPISRKERWVGRNGPVVGYGDAIRSRTCTALSAASRTDAKTESRPIASIAPPRSH
jgi:hypothetical protein